MYRNPAISSFFPGMRSNMKRCLTTPDALPAVDTLLIILDDAIVRALGGFLNAGIQTAVILTETREEITE